MYSETEIPFAINFSEKIDTELTQVSENGKNAESATCDCGTSKTSNTH